jgi:hypothetical protein
VVGENKPDDLKDNAVGPSNTCDIPKALSGESRYEREDTREVLSPRTDVAEHCSEAVAVIGGGPAGESKGGFVRREATSPVSGPGRAAETGSKSENRAIIGK